MSHQNNTNLLERAAEVLEEIQSHPSGYDKELSKALDDNDLDQVGYWVNRIEGELAQEHYRNYDLLVF